MVEEAGQPARKVQKERNKEKRERKKKGGRTEGIKKGKGKGKGKEGSLIISVVALDRDLAFHFVHPHVS